MTTAYPFDDVEKSTADWLQRAFAAERAPRPCRLPVPQAVSRASAQRRPAPLARGSFVLMLSLSASVLLLQL